ncbi:MAG: hypothetical protein ACKO38_07675, partial [Planctomycetota bacterium]
MADEVKNDIGRGAAPMSAQRAAQVKSLRMPSPQGSSGSGKLAWFLVALLTLAIPWLVWRERQLVARFNRILAEGSEDGDWSPGMAVDPAASDAVGMGGTGSSGAGGARPAGAGSSNGDDREGSGPV